MTREETAINKFETLLTDKQKAIVKKKILQSAINEAHTLMEKKRNARLYPTMTVHPSASGIEMLMFQWGYHTHQLWGRDDENADWRFYKFDK